MYIKKTDKILPNGLKQCWLFDISVNGTASAKRLIELKQKRVISDLDIEILKFLYNYDACPIEYIAKGVGFEDVEQIQARVDKMLSQHIINAFMLTDGAEIKVKDDAKLFYCLDAGGAILLRAYGDDKDLLDYRMENLVLSSTKVSKRLMAMDFMFKLKDTLGSRLLWFKVDPMLTCGGSKYVPKAFFTLATEDGDKKAYLLEIVKFDEFYEADSVRLSDKFAKCDAIVNTNAWKKYHDGKTAPTLLIYADDNDAAIRCAQLADTSGMIEHYRLCTEESMKKSLSTAFMKYEDDKLKSVKSTNFTKDKK